MLNNRPRLLRWMVGALAIVSGASILTLIWRARTSIRPTDPKDPTGDPTPSDPQYSTKGRWVRHGVSEILAVHAALLPSGKVLYFSGSEHDELTNAPYDTTRLWDPQSGEVQGTRPASYVADLFCCGHALLPDGRLLAAGGTSTYDSQTPHGPHQSSSHFTGIRSSAIFDWRDESRWQPGPLMAAGRWYPTLLTLHNGKVLALSGHPNVGRPAHVNTDVELFDPATNQWTTAEPTVPWPLDPRDSHFDPWAAQVYYPRLHVIPQWKGLFSSTPFGMLQGLRGASETQQALPSGSENRSPESAIEQTGQPRQNPFFVVAEVPPYLRHRGSWPPPTGDSIYEGPNFSSVLLPLMPPDYWPRILIWGGRRPRVLDFRDHSKGWQEIGIERGYERRAYLDSVLLPDGTVLFVNGATSERVLQPPFLGGLDSDGLRYPELYDPTTNRFKTLASSLIPRVYHSVALLLPDARVWVAGSNHDSVRNKGGYKNGDPSQGDARELRIETFAPPYLFKGPRPVLAVVPESVRYGDTIAVSSSTTIPIASFALLRCGSVTHAFNADQRYIGLQASSNGPQSMALTMPPSGWVAPPGYYLLFAVSDKGVPSKGAFIRLGP
jgi:hypothetical protein